MNNYRVKEIDKVREEAVKEYVKNNYNIYDFLVSQNVISSNFNGNAIPCLRNDDKTASMKINFNTNQFKCFSCGTGGSYIHLVVHYKVDVLGERTFYHKEMEEIVKSDVKLQALLGFNTIYKSKKKEISLDRRVLNKDLKLTYRMVNKKLANADIETKVYAIALAEGGIEPLEIMKTIRPNEYKKEFDMSIIDSETYAEVDEDILDMFR